MENKKIVNVILSIIAIIVNTESIKNFSNFITIKQINKNSIRTKKIPLFIFILLASSMIANVDASSTIPNMDNAAGVLGNSGKIIDQSNSIKTESHRHFQVSSSENIGISDTNGNPQNDQVTPNPTPILKNKYVVVQETLSFRTEIVNPNVVLIAKHESQFSTTLERISNVVKIRYNGKIMFVDDLSWNHHSAVTADFIKNIKLSTINWNDDNPLKIVEKLLKTLSYKNNFSTLAIASGSNDLLSSFSQSIDDNINRTTHGVDNLKNPAIFLLLVPLSGYILARSEEVKLEFFRMKQFVSFCFLIILVSSVIVTPLSISPTFLSYAYAEQMNNTQSPNPLTNSSMNSSGTLPPIQSSTLSSQISNNTSNLLLNQTANNSTLKTSNTSLVTNSTNSTTNAPLKTNSTLNTVHTNSTLNTVSANTTSILDSMKITDAITAYLNSNLVTPLVNATIVNATAPTNETSKVIIPNSVIINNSTSNASNSTIVTLPNATKSWQFNSLPNSTTTKTTLKNITNTSSLQLTGTGYLTENVNSTRNLSALSISAWIKPDYSQGSPQFTVISKENQFAMSINNLIPPQKIAAFSVYNGIKWYTVNSTIPIEENWTHLAATFNGSSISIYVNGTLQSTLSVSGVPTLSVNGQLTTKTIDSLSSNADIVIGAYLNTLRGTPSNKFSGSIESVNLYNSTLSQSQIAQLYDTNVLSGITKSILENSTNSNSTSTMSSTKTNSTGLSDAISFTDTVSISTNSTTLTNATSVIDGAFANATITPQLTTVKKSYLLTETPHLDFQYLNDSNILKNAQKEIKNDLSTINKVEENLNKTEVVVNGTATSGISHAVEQINQTQVQINSAQIQIDTTQAQLMQAQQTIATAEKTKSLQQFQEALNQTVAAKEDVHQVASILNDTVDQIKQTAQDVNTKNLTSSAQTITTSAASLNDTTQSQSGKWTDSNQTISVQTIDPKGSITSVQTTIDKVVDGKFDITLNSTRSITPGLYTIKATLIKDGKTYTTQDQFMWGLVSLNTKKSIYRPGETANFIITVLDNGGHPVCNSAITMDVTNPNSQITTLTTGNGIIPDAQCGLYDANYTTTSEGNYTINVNAQNPSGTANFGTSFLVQKSFDFDIVRTADSKIDPVSNQNLFNVRIDIESFVSQDNLKIQEFVPSSFNVITDASVETVGDTKILTWNKNVIGNKTSVQYSYSVPLEFPKLYALGPAEIHYGLDQTFTEARPWYVANDPPAATIHIGPVVDGAITFANTLTSGTITVDSNPNRLLMVGVSWRVAGSTGNNGGTPTISAIKLDGITSIKSNLIPGTMVNSTAVTATAIYGLLNPTSGAHSVTVTFTSKTNATVGVMEFSGADQSSLPNHANGTWGGSATTLTTTLTTNQGNSYLFEVASPSSTDLATTASSGQTKVWNNAGNGTVDQTGVGGYKPALAQGKYTESWNIGATGHTWSMAIVEIKSAGNAVPSEPTILFTDSVSAKHGFGKSITESNIPFTDSVSAKHGSVKSIAESNIPFTDSVSAKHGSSKSIAESNISITDSASTFVVHNKSASISEQTILFTDSASTSVVHNKSASVSESPSFTDSVSTSSRTMTKSISELPSFTDSVSTNRTITKS
ncbi:MAG TPA: LamG-like jellyroll fold domain-containing protein, partial [Nitrosopumilaceae archaeon]|nr:LamG-like jellyroll fold domain-containing protein [Nitrosopumilaceae archaeon]